MARRTQAISEDLLQKCKAKLKAIGSQGESGRRLQAIISGKAHDISKVCEIYNITRQTMMNWIESLEKEGIEGFQVKKGRGRKTKLDGNSREELKRFVEEAGSTLTARKLKLEVAKRYSKEIGLSSAHRLLRELGFAHITGRPKHYKQDVVLYEEF